MSYILLNFKKFFWLLSLYEVLFFDGKWHSEKPINWKILQGQYLPINRKISIIILQIKILRKS